MTSSNNRVLQIYNARKTILELLHTKGNYNIDDYKGFSINEIDVMLNSNQLDMLFTEGENGSKTYVKFHLGKNLNESSLQPIIEDLFILTDTLTPGSSLLNSPGISCDAVAEILLNSLSESPYIPMAS